MNNALVYLGGLLITIFAALFAAPHFVDWNSYRGLFEEEASRVLSREVRVGGAVNVRFLPTPYVQFERVRIADAASSTGGSLIRIENFTMWLSVPPLLRGVIEANRIELKKPVLQLATDANGNGNWSTLSFDAGSMPFVPRDVALQSVEISDGAIILSTPDMPEIARVSDIAGELTAEAANGPFKFGGTLAWEGKPRKVQIATGKFGEPAGVQIKARVEAPETGNSYLLDARATDIMSKLAFTGELTAKLDPARWLATPAPAATDAKDAAAPSPAVAPPAKTAGELTIVEMRSKIAGSAEGANLSDLNVTFDAGATPQLLTGEASLSWVKRSKIDVKLSSRWLDIDKIKAGGSDAQVPLESARALLGSLAAALPAEAETSARLDFDQLTLGQEPISDVHVLALRDNGPLTLKEVRASLPGGTRLEMAGEVKSVNGSAEIDGTVFMSGQSLLRFLAWGFASPAISEGRTDGPFSLDGRLALAAQSIEISDATAEVTGTPLHGSMSFMAGERQKLSLMVEGSKIDAAQIRTGILGLGTLASFYAPENGTEAPMSPITNDADVAVHLRVAELSDGSRLLKDVDAEIKLEKGKLSIPTLEFKTPDDLKVSAEGEIMGLPAAPVGVVRAVIEAGTTDAAKRLVELLDLTPGERTIADRLVVLAPMRLAATLNLSGTASGASELTVDGTASSGTVKAKLRLEGGRKTWYAAPADATVSVDGIALGALLAAAFDIPQNEFGPDAAKPARLALKASGTPRDGLLALADVTTETASLTYRGRITASDTTAVSATGDIKAIVADGRDVLLLAGLPLAGGAVGSSLSGTAALTLDDKGLTLSTSDLLLADVPIKATVTSARAGDGTRSIAADIEAREASFGALLAAMLANRDQAAEVAAEPAPQARLQAGRMAQPVEQVAKPIWSEASFALSGLEKVSGTVKAKVAALSVEPGLTISNATIDASFGPRGVNVTSLAGDALGGKLQSALNFERAPAGVALGGNLAIKIGSAPGATEPAASFTTEFQGRALNPLSLVSSLVGKGEVTLADASVSGMSPSAVTAVIETSLASKQPLSGDPLLQAIKTAIRQGELKIGKIKIPATIGDGTMKLDKVAIQSNDGRATFTTVVELETMHLDSEWKIEPKLARFTGPPERAFLPPVTVVYAGKLAEFASLEPMVSLQGLERELAVRKMERDVEELERLRKLDQQRALEEKQRREAAQAERERAAAEQRQRLMQQRQGVTPEAAPVPATGTDTPTPPPQGAAPGVPAPQGAAPPPTGDASQSASNEPAGAAAADGATAMDATTPTGDAAANAAAPSPAPRPARRRPAEAWRPFENGP